MGISGFVQEFFKAIGPIIGLILLKDRLKVNPIVLGVVAGAGFGLAEASVMTWNASLSFWGVFERFSAICFDVGASLCHCWIGTWFFKFPNMVFHKEYLSVVSLEVLAFFYSLMFVIVLIMTCRREEACVV